METLYVFRIWELPTQGYTLTCIKIYNEYGHNIASEHQNSLY